jgi:hypothetical protein
MVEAMRVAFDGCPETPSRTTPWICTGSAGVWAKTSIAMLKKRMARIRVMRIGRLRGTFSFNITLDFDELHPDLNSYTSYVPIEPGRSITINFQAVHGTQSNQNRLCGVSRSNGAGISRLWQRPCEWYVKAGQAFRSAVRRTSFGR